MIVVVKIIFSIILVKVTGNNPPPYLSLHVEFTFSLKLSIHITIFEILIKIQFLFFI